MTLKVTINPTFAQIFTLQYEKILDNVSITKPTFFSYAGKDMCFMPPSCSIDNMPWIYKVKAIWVTQV